MKKPVDPFYYLSHFEFVLERVKSLYGDLLSSGECEFLRNFESLPKQAKGLWVRLAMRKGVVFRAERLRYPELPHPKDYLVELHERGFLGSDVHEPLDDILALYSKTELLKRLREEDRSFPSASRLTKSQLVAEILQRQLVQDVIEDAEIVTLQGKSWFELFQVLFFGNWYQDLSAFIISHLDILVYEPYSYDKRTRLFKNREEIEIMLKLKHAHDVMEWTRIHGFKKEVELLAEDLGMLTLPPDAPPFLVRRFGRLCLAFGAGFERNRNLEKALEWYEKTNLPPSRERQVRILSKLGQSDGQQEIVLAMRDNPLSPEEWYFSSWGPFSEATSSIDSIIDIEHLQLSYSGRVEDAVRDVLGAESCFFTENYFWKSLFGLFFWDIIFASVSGAFVNPFQSGPLDLWDPSFGLARKKLIDERLELFRNSSWKAWIKDIKKQKYGFASSLVHWDFIESVPFDNLVEHLSGNVLKAIFLRMLKNLRYFRTGFPDLMQIALDTPMRFRLIEVKGPGDVLRPNQLAWMRHFKNLEIPCKLIKVDRIKT